MAAKIWMLAVLVVMPLALAEEASPITKVVKLLSDLKARVEKDGAREQKMFDKQACWCEEKLGEKSNAINDAKALISEQQTLIEKLNGDLGSGGATVAQLKKDIGKNKVAQNDAKAMRAQEHAEYEASKNNLESQTATMEAAIKAITQTKTGFLDISKKTKVLSVVGQVRRLVDQGSVPASVALKDMELLKSFLAKPEDFFAASHTMSALQNPFGDYAPQSTQIQGIFKGLYDNFVGELEKSNGDEAESQKSFEDLMATKNNEFQTLEGSRLKAEKRQASNQQKLSDAKTLRDDTAEQLEADETFFADTKDSCEKKAVEWSTRSRLRTEELSGMEQALAILSGGAKTFGRSWTTFVQVSSINTHHTEKNNMAKAFGKLKALATQYKSMKIARVALAARAGGHFDVVMKSIDTQIAELREEEQADIKHRDHCENMMNANANEIADLTHSIKKLNQEATREGTANEDRKREERAIEGSIEQTAKDMQSLTAMRNEEHADFVQALTDDETSVSLMGQAIAALGKFYENNGKFVQTSAKGPDSVDANYGGRKSETTGVIGLLDMLVEDLEKEIAEGKADDADAQEKYLGQLGAMQAGSDALTETKVSIEKEIADGTAKINALNVAADEDGVDKKVQLTKKLAIATDCAWVKSHFKTRRDKRKSEIQGLQDANEYLSGGGDGLPPLE